jgi:hypothetical protein
LASCPIWQWTVCPSLHLNMATCWPAQLGRDSFTHLTVPNSFPFDFTFFRIPLSRLIVRTKHSHFIYIP